MKIDSLYVRHDSNELINHLKSNKPTKKRPVPSNSSGFFESSIPIRKHRKLTEICQKQNQKFPIRILLPHSRDFRYFSAEYSDFLAPFHQYQKGSGGRDV